MVGHYAAGARLIGLTEKQMAKHLATLSVTGGENQDSPYAQPLCMFTTNIPSKLLRKQRAGHGRIRLTVVKAGDTPKDQISNENNGEENNLSTSVEPNVRLYTLLETWQRTLHNPFHWYRDRPEPSVYKSLKESILYASNISIIIIMNT